MYQDTGRLRKELILKIKENCGKYPAMVREKQPLIHMITNYVTVNDCVNAVLAAGAKGICSHDLREAAQVAAGADGLVCNLGGTEYYDAMESAAKAAYMRGIPVVIDPVGCAASGIRKDMCLELVKRYHPAAVRGNYAEIGALVFDPDGAPADGNEPTRAPSNRGLDCSGELSESNEEALRLAMAAFSKESGVILIASGSTDICTDGERFIDVKAGSPAQKRITGAGCMATAVLAAYLAAECSLLSAAAATSLMGLCGEAAHKAAVLTGTGAGHFHMFFMDALSVMDDIWKG